MGQCQAKSSMWGYNFLAALINVSLQLYASFPTLVSAISQNLAPLIPMEFKFGAPHIFDALNIKFDDPSV